MFLAGSNVRSGVLAEVHVRYNETGCKTARRTHMATYVLLTKFTDQGIRGAKDSPKRAEAFKKMAETFGATVRELF